MTTWLCLLKSWQRKSGSQSLSYSHDRQRRGSTDDCWIGHFEINTVEYRSLQEELDVLTTLDREIINFVDEGSVVSEIEQADIFKEGIYSTMVKLQWRFNGLDNLWDLFESFIHKNSSFSDTERFNYLRSY